MTDQPMEPNCKLRPVKALVEGKTLRRNPIAPPPKIAWLSLDQLVVDETYQRALSSNSKRLIRRLVETWDWNCFKPLSVAAAGGGLYEVIDGQHTAIAAATHGAVETLPCLVLDARTLKERASAFVGINRDRVPLTPFALYQARLAAGDEEAVAVDRALTTAGANLEETLRSIEEYPAGTVGCVATLLQIVRRGGHARLARLLQMCIAAEITPVPSAVLKGLEEVITAPNPPTDARLVEILSDLGGEDLLDRAAERRKRGLAISTNDGVAQVLMMRLETAKAA